MCCQGLQVRISSVFWMSVKIWLILFSLHRYWHIQTLQLLALKAKVHFSETRKNIFSLWQFIKILVYKTLYCTKSIELFLRNKFLKSSEVKRLPANYTLLSMIKSKYLNPVQTRINKIRNRFSSPDSSQKRKLSMLILPIFIFCDIFLFYQIIKTNFVLNQFY